MRVGKRKRVVPGFVLLKSQSDIRVLDKISGRSNGQCVVDTIDMVAIAKIMVNTQSAAIANEPAWELSLVSADVVGAVNRACRRIDRRGEADLREVRAYQTLNGWIQKPRGNCVDSL